jgi:protein-S-isoprenylcysteine O-methyltransferase Ste14
MKERTKTVNSKSSSTSEAFNSPIVMWVIIVAGILLIFRYFDNNRIIPPNRFLPLLFVIALLYWLYFAASAVSAHPDAAKSVARIKGVVSTGVYAKVRHPIYSAYIVLGVGIFFLWPRIAVLISVTWGIIVLIIWMLVEENALKKKFGKQYENYQNRVPMIIPKFRN